MTAPARIGPSGVDSPSLSVVICTKDRPEALLRCVDSVAAQDVRPRELIVIDDGDVGEAVLECVKARARAAGLTVVYRRKSPPGLPASRNLAVRLASGDIVQFLDDDVTLERGFLRAVRSLYAEDSARALAGVEGTLVEPRDRGLAARGFDVLYRVAGWWALRPRPLRRPPRPACIRRGDAEEAWKIVGATMSFRHELLLAEPFDEALGGYALGEDRDLAYRLARRGWIVRARHARAVHHHGVPGKADPFAFGRMVVENYCRILWRSGMCGVGEWLVATYSLLLIGVVTAGLAIVRPRRYWPELKWMVCGALTALAGLNTSVGPSALAAGERIGMEGLSDGEME